MGDEIAKDVVEAWYSYLPERGSFPGISTYASVVEHHISANVFGVGVNPVDVLKAFDIGLLLIPRGAYIHEHCTKGWPDIVNSLLKIKNKNGFKLNTQFEQRGLSLNVWPAAFDMFRPVLEAFEKEGARIRIFVWYRAISFFPRTVEFDLNEYIKHPESNSREDAIAYFESKSRIQDVDRHYLRENEPDYDPELISDFKHDYEDWYKNHSDDDDDDDEDEDDDKDDDNNDENYSDDDSEGFTEEFSGDNNYMEDDDEEGWYTE